MKLRTWVEAFAIIASYLVMTMPMASAVTIKMYDPGGFESGSLTYSPSYLVNGEVSVNPQSLVLDIDINNASSSVNIEGVWLYMCGDLSPHECADSVTPVLFSGNVDASYDWADVSSGSPETANLLYFTRVNAAGKVSWLGFWKSVVRESPNNFVVTESDIDEVGVYATSPDIISTIMLFINNYHMIPANPAWVSRVVFEGASSLFEIGITGEESFVSPGKPASGETAGSEVSSVSNDYTFMLPVKSGVKSPVTLFLNPIYTCGMLGCETDKGETQYNCCLDCGCESVEYCDASYGCSDESLIGLGLYGTVDPRVDNCYESNHVSIPVVIANAPSSYSVAGSWCKLDGTYSSCDCQEASGDRFVCSLTVPPVDDCGSGEFRISNNGIRLKIEYMDGAAASSKFIETSFPDVTVGSFVCGESGCESDLGETWENCCYDCGCASGYCNYKLGAQPGTGICMDDPSSGDFRLLSMDPSHFPDHPDPGENVNMNIVIENSPRSLTLESVSCELGCEKGIEECESSCTVSCSELASGDPDKYNMSCLLWFTVSGYDAMSDYSLSPTLDFNIKYRNGTGSEISKNIVKPFRRISIGAHYCGDGDCGDDESSGTCCYDCECDPGYCDTDDRSGPAEGDGCRSLGFGVTIDNMGSLVLEDTTIDHNVLIEMHVNDYPSGIQIVPECTLAGGDVKCMISCTRIYRGELSDYHMDCMLTVPWMDYVTSDYYNPVTKKIVLTENSMNLSIFYNDGPEKAVVYEAEPLGDVHVEVTTSCGINGCESWEDESNCCRDCGCEDDGYFCYMGASPNGECVGNDTIDLRITGSEPDPWVCVIGKIGGDCKYLRRHIVTTHIVNAPSNTSVLDVSYRLDDVESPDINCLKTSVYGNLDCPIIPDKLPGSETKVNRTLEILMSIGYTINTTTGEEDFVKEISAERVFTTAGKRSDSLISCEDEIERMKEHLRRLKSNQNSYGSWGVWYFAIGAAMILAGYIMLSQFECLGACQQIAWTLILTGGMMIITGFLSKTMGTDVNVQFEQLEQQIEQRTQVCSSIPFEKTAEATEGDGCILFGGLLRSSCASCAMSRRVYSFREIP